MRFFAFQLILLFASIASAQSSETFLRQVGTTNVATVVQFSSLASLTQTGTENEARIEQTGGSSASVVQNGSGNVLAGFDLFGLRDPLATAYQLDSSQLVLSQYGTDNMAFVDQAAGAFAQITQNGTGNSVTVVQGTGAFQ